jgi:hypothetical protein
MSPPEHNQYASADSSERDSDPAFAQKSQGNPVAVTQLPLGEVLFFFDILEPQERNRRHVEQRSSPRHAAAEGLAREG